MPRDTSDESYPLLLLFLEDANKSPRRKKTFFIDKGRYNRITEGANNIIMKWPAHLSSCWLTTILFVISSLLLMMILFGTSAHQPDLKPRCKTLGFNESNITIFLVHHGPWAQKQFAAIEEMIDNYQEANIHIILLNNSTLKINKKRFKRSLQQPTETINKNPNKIKKKLKTKRFAKFNIKQLNINIGRRDVIKTITTPKILINVTKKIEPKINNFQALLNKYPNICVRNETMKDIFENTPLYQIWPKFDIELVEFAVRVIQLWDYGGISFKLPELYDENEFNLTNNPQKMKVYDYPRNVFRLFFEEELRFEALIQVNMTSFLNLPNGVVNMDNEGVHMETKTPCHALFGEILNNLRKVNGSYTNATSIIKSSLKTFCLTGAVDDDYCLEYYIS